MKFPGKGAYGGWGGQICGGSCATNFGYDEALGLTIRFDAPFEGQKGRETVAIKTSKGNIYLKLNMDKVRPSGIAQKISIDVPEGIEHHSVSLILCGSYSSPVGICLFANHTEYYQRVALTYPDTLAGNGVNYREYYNVMAEECSKKPKQIEDKLGNTLLYKSPLFYNSNHQDYPNPYLTLYVYDKEMKHEI